jgi:hypothetical protein
MANLIGSNSEMWVDICINHELSASVCQSGIQVTHTNESNNQTAEVNFDTVLDTELGALW